MKIGLLYLNEIKYDDLAWVLVSKGIDGEIIDTGISVDSTLEEDAKKVSELIKKSGIELVLTMDFCPAVSDACKRCGIKYAAWVYDNPQQALFNRQITNSCNYIFTFDKEQLKCIKELGAERAFHLPLATNVLRNSGLVITENDEYRYGCDVSFIGNMYMDNYFQKVCQFAPEKTAGEIDGIIRDAFGVWDGEDHITGKLSDSAEKDLIKICHFSRKDDYDIPFDKWILGRLFSRRLAYLERVELVKRLSFVDFRLYTTSSDFVMEGVDIWPGLSYDEELPKAYHLSKININCNLHSITSGVPLRVFDIMGVGGFVLSNYQPEIEDLFTIGSDIEVFRSFDEMEDKVRFYLTHEEERERIALNGYHTASDKYSYEAAFGKMIQYIEQYNVIK